MKDIFKTLVENHETGFCPIQMPTGSGKTRSILEFICDYIASGGERRIIFVTSQKKNLPDGSLRKFFEKENMAEIFDKIFLFLDSKEQTVVDNYNDEMKNAIFKVITDKDIISDFTGLIMSIRSFSESKRYQDKKTESILRERLRTTVEPMFRDQIRKKLGRFKDYGEKYNAVLNDPDWSWVSKLYPEVRTKDCKIIFMSADKFVMKNDTIVEGSYTMYDSDIVKDSIVFIDEFDSTKKVILNREIEMSVNRNLDYMKVANQICEKMKKIDKHPDDMYKPSEEMIDEPNPDHLRSFASSVRDKLNDVFDKYNLEYKFLMDMDPDASEFLFYKRTTHYVEKGQNKFLSVNCDRGRGINVIKGSNNKDDMFHFNGMFTELSNTFRYFFSFIRKLALNCKFSQKEKGTPIGYEYCIRSVLSIFDLDEDTKDYFTSEILTMQPSNDDKKSEVEDGSIYEKGFSVYNLKNENDHVFNSIIKLISHNIMPEKILLKVCNNAFVFGVSATATLDTVTGNYDLTYIKTRLKTKFIELDDTMRAKLKVQFNNSVSDFKGNVEVMVKTISACSTGGEYDANLWDVICSKKINAEHIRNLLDRGSDDDFHKARYLKIAMVYCEFLMHKDIRSLLCFLNRHPKEDDDELNTNKLGRILTFINDCHKDTISELNTNETLFYLNGDNFDVKKDELLKKLGRGDKVFVITAYNTLGAGQNIQYPVESLNGLIRINKDLLITESETGRPLEKDFDAIYLEYPRNIIPFATKNKKMKDIIEQIAITESLYERAEITNVEEKVCIRGAFSFNEFEINKCKGICRNTLSANNQAAGQIIQAVGRICRTPLKNPIIYIFADESLGLVFVEKPEYYGELLNFETEVLIDKLNTYDESNSHHCIRLANKGQDRSKRAVRYIDKLMRMDWSDDCIAKWESLRNHVLMHPTTSDDSDDIAYHFYVEVPNESDKYWYTTEDDFKSVKILFDKGFNVAESVSGESARLEELLHIPGIKELFEERCYATSFKKERFILSPPLFKNIYKGALGEAVGERIMWDRFKTKLIKLDAAEYEKFDFKTEDGRFYFDFKHWNSSNFVETDIHDKIIEKMKEVGISNLFIINILKPNLECNNEVRHYEREGFNIWEVPYLYDAKLDQWNDEAIFTINRGIRL